MKKGLLILFLFVASLSQTLAQRPIKLQNQSDSISYSLGFLSGYQISDNYPGIENRINYELFMNTFKSTLSGEMPFVDEDKMKEFVDEQYTAIKRQIWKDNREAGERFLAENRNKPGIFETASGLQYEVVRAGSDDNERPRAYDDMVISYVGKTLGGAVFEEDDHDSTYPANLNSGLEEATQLMSPGAKYKVYLPYQLAFGDDGNRKVPPYSTVIYEVEMLSMTRDHNYYDEDEDTVIDRSAWDDGDNSVSDVGEPQSREAGDYMAVTLPNTRLDVSVSGYDRDDIVKTYESEGFRIVLTGDRTIVFDGNGREVFRNTLDEESNSYDAYHLTEFRHNNGEGPLYLVLDMGFQHGSYYGSMVYTIENGVFTQIPDFLNLVVFNRNDDDEHYGRLTPIIDLYRANGLTTFMFETPALSYNPAGVEVIIPGEDFQYVVRNGKLEEAGAATNLTYFQVRNLACQFEEKHGVTAWYSELGDVNGDGRSELVIFARENETIYVCSLDGNRLGGITEFDLPYEYTIDRSTRVLRGGTITVRRDDDNRLKRLVVHNGNLVEKDTTGI